MRFGTSNAARRALATAGVLALTTGCLDRPVCADCQPETSTIFLQRVPTGRVDKIDLVFMIDNSASMADKQRLLVNAVPSLMSRFVTPLCVDRDGAPNGERAMNGVCASGAPEFPPMEDIHVAVISSSLGTNGGAACAEGTSDDRAWLFPLAHPELGLDSWAGSGFLAWDPTGARNTPPGSNDRAAIASDFQDMVAAVGERGCGYEASLESWYRFLVAPDPPQAFQEQGAVTVPVGIDQGLLEQRERFLRSDSLVVILMLSDENDCSFRLHSSASKLSLDNVRFPRGTSVCATNPSDPCCRSCGNQEQSAPPGCTPLAEDAACSTPYTELQDPRNLRCFDHKRRFGIDLLEPVDKYVRGLTAETVFDRDGNPQPNPLFAARHGKPPRDKSLVYLAGIVGVPWQDISTPESLSGPGLRYLDAKELVAERRWDVILGDPATGKLPSDPHMIESVAERSGDHPLFPGFAIQPNGTASPTADPISGHEQRPPKGDDLQYACIFELPTPNEACANNRDNCGDCDRGGIEAGRPLCKNPAGGGAGNTQYFAKAYPGLRQLQVLKGIGEQGIVASVCAKVVRSAAPDSDPSFGYNPAVNALVDRLKAPLANQCLARPPAINDDGSLSCAVVEADFGDACDCAKPGRRAVRQGLLAGVQRDLKQSGLCADDGPLPRCNDVCGCEIAEAQSDALAACRSTADPAAQTPGYCYVDPGADLGAAELVQGCPESRKRLLRFVGADTPTDGSIAFMACLGATFSGAQP